MSVFVLTLSLSVAISVISSALVLDNVNIHSSQAWLPEQQDHSINHSLSSSQYNTQPVLAWSALGLDMLSMINQIRRISIVF